MTGKPTTIETPSVIARQYARSVPRAHEAPDATTRAAQRRIIIIGTPSDIPRALEHQAVVTGRFMVDAIIAIDPESEDIQEVGTRLLEALRAHAVTGGARRGLGGS